MTADHHFLEDPAPDQGAAPAVSDAGPADVGSGDWHPSRVRFTQAPPPADPMAVATAYARRIGYCDDAPTLRYWRGDFYAWTGTYWRPVDRQTVRADLYRALETASYSKAAEGEDGEVVEAEVRRPWAPNRHKIADVVDALQAVVHLSEYIEPPAWIEGAGDGDLIAMGNGLLSIATRRLTGHTPRFFNTSALPYDYDPHAADPQRWVQFLGQLWSDDQESVALLQQFFGYVLSSRTDLHKIMLLVGPPRSGKGTLARILTALVGRDNMVGPTLASLGTHFGLQPLLGKSVAIISDARLGSGTPVSTVVERLLTVSGEDGVTVDRKYREPWTGKLGARFMLISNELPNLADASGAITTRLLVLSLRQSWLGKEDPRLTATLLEELPGILRWALDGLDTLRTQGRFTEPKTSHDAAVALADLASPVSAFLRDRCERGPTYTVSRDELYAAWRSWCEEQGRDRITTKAVFGRDLRAAAPELGSSQPQGADGKKHWHYAGLRLRPRPEATTPTHLCLPVTGAPDNGQAQAQMQAQARLDLQEHPQSQASTGIASLRTQGDSPGAPSDLDTTALLETMLGAGETGSCSRCGALTHRYGDAGHPYCPPCRARPA